MKDRRRRPLALSIRTTAEALAMVDAYRRGQNKIPTCTEAVEKLISLGFLAWKKEHGMKQEK